jgi:oligopeptide/dipeptide ABC transporter ATP-binding protein
MSDILLSVRDLKTYFYTDDGVVPAVDGVSFELERGGTLGIVGESGCGKSVTSLTIMGLIPQPPGKIEGGVIEFEGRDLLKLSEAEMRHIRGNEISMIFQEPMTSLNPVFTVGNQIMEAIMLHQNASKTEAREKAIEMLRLVGIPSPEKRIDDYPHQMSGGMRQRVMIAMALSCNPKLLIADEPTTALDVTIQAQVLELMKALRVKFNTSVLLITHDFGVVAEMCDKCAVMYAGEIVEYGTVEHIFRNPQHPYTKGLFASLPDLESDAERLQPIVGLMPNPMALPHWCSFADRCSCATEACRKRDSILIETEPGHFVKCIRFEQNKEA